MPMQYTEIFKFVKNEKFQFKSFDIFLIFAQNIDFRFTLEPPRRGSSNKYPQSMFWIKNMKNRFTPTNPFFYRKVGFKGVYFSWTFFGDVYLFLFNVPVDNFHHVEMELLLPG